MSHQHSHQHAPSPQPHQPHSHSSHSHGHTHQHHPSAPPPPYTPPPPPAGLLPLTSPRPTSENLHRATVCATFDLYRLSSLSSNQRRRADYYSLSPTHQALLPGYKELLAAVDERLEGNSRFVKDVIEVNPFAPEQEGEGGEAALEAEAPGEADHERLRSTLRQVVRDWSIEGKPERDTTYTPILEALERQFADLDEEERAQTKVLVPGAGLGRLAWEIVRQGFSCQANEFSLHMLIVSNYILNHITTTNQYPLHPYLHSFSNSRSTTDLLSPIFIPDVLPNEIEQSLNGAEFSFAAGDFLEIYGGKGNVGTFDAVVTCFFIDTARNIVQYLETIWKVLREGGTWINCGPTLWHFENTEGASSIELTVEDVKSLARRIGFEISV